MVAQVILDTNFIITCVKQRIDFFHELRTMGFHIIIPKQVIQELEKLKRALELKVLEKNRGFFRMIRFKRGYVDKGMVEFGNEHPRAIIATLDSALKKQLKNRIMVIRRMKTLEVV